MEGINGIPLVTAKWLKDCDWHDTTGWRKKINLKKLGTARFRLKPLNNERSLCTHSAMGKRRQFHCLWNPKFQYTILILFSHLCLALPRDHLDDEDRKNVTWTVSNFRVQTAYCVSLLFLGLAPYFKVWKYIAKCQNDTWYRESLFWI